jgi:polyhydroxyalkanoate synthase
MPKNSSPRSEKEAEARLRSANDRLAEELRESNRRFVSALEGEAATPQVMAGFAEAYRAWLESLSARPEILAELQNRYMQEQFRLWANALQPAGDGEPPAADKRFSAPEWNDLPVFRYFRDSYLATSKMMMEAVEASELDPATKQRMRFFMRQYLDAVAP